MLLSVAIGKNSCHSKEQERSIGVKYKIKYIGNTYTACHEKRQQRGLVDSIRVEKIKSFYSLVPLIGSFFFFSFSFNSFIGI